jgi:hypothetical protein
VTLAPGLSLVDGLASIKAGTSRNKKYSRLLIFWVWNYKKLFLICVTLGDAEFMTSDDASASLVTVKRDVLT